MTMPIEDARMQPPSEAESQRRPWLDPSRLRLGLTFLAGLLLGWLLLGWWLFPVQWGPATPAHLAPGARDDYLQLVAESFARAPDLDRTRQRLDDLSSLQIGSSLHRLARGGSEQAADARGLAEALAIDLEAADVVAASAAETAAEPRAGDASDPNAGGGATEITAAPEAAGDGADWQLIWRWISYLALAGAIAAGLLLAWSWWRWRQGSDSTGRAEPEPARPVGVPGATALPRGASLEASARATRSAAETSASEVTRAMPSVEAARSRPAGGASGGGRRAQGAGPQPGSGGPSWQPERIELGQTVDARYHSAEHQAIHTWLVYDRRGALVGGAGLMAQSIGGINTLDLWFSDREDVDQTSRTPTVTFVTQQAYDDPVLRARLSDRRLVAAVPGQSAGLETVDLRLDVEVVAVEALAEAHPSLQALVLALTPQAQPGTGLHRAVAVQSRFEDDGDADEDEDWDRLLDEEIDEAFDPPRPMHFRRDE